MLAADRIGRPPAVQADVCALPIASSSLGGVVAAFVLNHVREPAAALRECLRVCAPGSPILVSTYAEDDIHPVKHAAMRALEARGFEMDPWIAELYRDVVPLMATVEPGMVLCGFVLAVLGNIGFEGALVYYNAIRQATQSVVLRSICEQILADEVPHIHFQCQRLANLQCRRSRPGLLFTAALQRVLFAAITLAIWLGHRRALRAGGYRFPLFWRSVWRACGEPPAWA